MFFLLFSFHLTFAPIPLPLLAFWPKCTKPRPLSTDIAFSKPYLEANQMVRISPELSFRVETVRSGRTFDFDAEQAKTRYCALASGKLRVCLEGQPEFTIGTHGVFTIKPGTKGWVQNRLYVDSVLHVSAVESGG